MAGKSGFGEYALRFHKGVRRFICGVAAAMALVISLGMPLPALTADSDPICWITEAWPKFTQEDGTGVYHDLIAAIFATQKVAVKVTYAPWKRAVETVKHGRCDMTGGIETSGDFHQSKYPIFERQILIVYRKKRLEWNGLESLAGKRGVWVRGFFNDKASSRLIEIADGDEVTDFQTALRMLNAGRSDYFIGGTHALKNYSKLVPGMDLSNFEIENVGSGQLYMSFPRTDRGATIREFYDRGVRALGQAAISKIYDKWGLDAPVLER